MEKKKKTACLSVRDGGVGCGLASSGLGSGLDRLQGSERVVIARSKLRGPRWIKICRTSNGGVREDVCSSKKMARMRPTACVCRARNGKRLEDLAPLKPMSFRPQKESVREAAAIGYPLASNTRPKLVLLSSQASIRAASSNNLPLAGDYTILERSLPAKGVWSRPCLEAGQEVGATVVARVDCERNASLGDMLRMVIPLNRTITTSCSHLRAHCIVTIYSGQTCMGVSPLSS